MGLTFLLADSSYTTRIESEITFIGTQIYCAPDVLSGAQNNFGLDIWSLGVVIYEILRGFQLGPDKWPKAWCNRLALASRN